MNKRISRRTFLRVLLLANTAAVMELFSPKIVEAAAQYNRQPEAGVLNQPFNIPLAVDHNPLAVDPISIHHKPGVIYIRG